jgi:hypothetical protein
MAWLFYWHERLSRRRRAARSMRRCLRSCFAHQQSLAHTLFVAMPDGPAFEVHGIGNDGVVSPVDIARGVWASRRGTPPPIASVAAIGSTTSYKFNSPVDEMLSNVRFDVIDKPDSERAGFRSHVREQLDRLHRHGLLIGKNSPGPQFPQAMRNVEHTISLCTDADLRKVSATWHRYAPDALTAMNETFDGLLRAVSCTASSAPTTSPTRLSSCRSTTVSAKSSVNAWSSISARSTRFATSTGIRCRSFPTCWPSRHAARIGRSSTCRTCTTRFRCASRTSI